MLVPVVGAFAEMSSDVDALADVIALALAANHVQFFSISDVEAKGMYKQRIRTAWDHAAHQGRARVRPRRAGLPMVQRERQSPYFPEPPNPTQGPAHGRQKL